jgi:hypothetical protein
MRVETMVSRNGLFFSVSLRARMTLDYVAAKISTALQVPLKLSEERGTKGDYVGELAGLHLWLFVAEQPTADLAPRFALVGGPDHDLDPDATWLDIGSYIAELLTERTGATWTTSSGQRVDQDI